MKKRTTITDIAKALNVTPATVSRALNGHSDVSAKMKKLIFETAEKMDYHRNKMASSLRSGKTHVIGVIIPSAAHNFFGSVIHGIVNIADKHDYEVLIHQSNESYDYEVKGIKALLGARVDGILASLARDTKDYQHFIKATERNTPVVFFDRAAEGIGLPSVVIDDFSGAYAATEHLIQQGYKRIAHLAGPQHIKAFNDRLLGYKAALEAYQMPFNPQLIFPSEITVESGMWGAEQLLALGNLPDAIYAVEDFTALGVLKLLKSKGIKLPEDIGLIGFCNDLSGEHTSPTLSTVDQQTIKMGEEAFQLLYGMLSDESGEVKKDSKKVVLDPILIARQSTNRLKRNF